MKKRNTFLFYILFVFLFISSCPAFADPVVKTTPLTLSAGEDNQLGAGYDSVNVDFSVGQQHVGAIHISGGAIGTLVPTLTSLKTTGSGQIYGIYVLENSHLNVTAPYFSISSSILRGNAIFLQNGTANFQGDLNISTAANTNGGINSTGKAAIGTFNGDVVINTSEEYSDGVHMSTDSTLIFNKSLSITTVSDFSRAIALIGSAESGMNLTVTEPATLITSGKNANGIFISDEMNVTTFKDNLTISTSGTDADGIRTNYGPTINILGDLDVSVTGNESRHKEEYEPNDPAPDTGAIHLDNNSRIGGGLSVTGTTTVYTKEGSVRGLFIRNSANATFGNTTSVTTEGVNAEAVYVGRNSLITFDGLTTITTSGDGAYALVLNGSSSQKANVVFNNEATISTTGIQGIGIYAYNGTVTFNDEIEIRTTNDTSYGIFLDSNGNVIFNEYATISTTKEDTYAIVLLPNSNIKFNNGASITTAGTDADAIAFLAVPTDSVFNGVYVKADKGFALSNSTTSNLPIDFTGASEIRGDIINYEDSQVYGSISLNLYNTSLWEGHNPDEGNGTISLALYNDSSWIISKDSFVDSLIMNDDSKVVFAYGDLNDFYSARTNELSGQGILAMNVDLSLKDGPKGDKFYANEASGNFQLAVNHNDKGGAQDLQLIYVSNDTSVDFSLLDDAPNLQIGSFIYELESREDNKEWWLNLVGEDEVMDDKFKGGVFGLFEFAKSIDATLSDELVYPKDNLWIVSLYKRQNFSDSELSGTLKQQIAGGIAGLTLNINDHFSVGDFFGLNVGYQNIAEESVGHIANLTLGAYANYNKRNFNAGIYLRISNYIHDLRLKKISGDFLNETLYTNGFSVSAQLSQRINLFSPIFYIEPKAKASYTYVAGNPYDIGGKEMITLNEDALVTWLGSRIGIDIDKENISSQYYLELGWLHDTNPSITCVVPGNEPEESSITIGKNRFEVGIGLNSSLFEATSLNVEFKYAKGQGITEPVKIKISASAKF